MSTEIELKMTCGACPEQYDAYINGEKVGYLRLRHGNFTVQVPDPNGRLVYDAKTLGDGVFEESERDYHLARAKYAITSALGLTTGQRITNQDWLVNRLIGIVTMVREGTWNDDDVAYEAAAIRDQIET